MVAKVGACLIGIEVDLCDQRVEGVVMRFIAQLAQKIDLDQSAIGVAPPVEQMGFEQWRTAGLDRRSGAQACDTGQRLIGQAMDANDKNAGQRGSAMRNAQIERWKAKFAAELSSVDDMAGDRIGSTEQALGAGEVALIERGAHSRAGDPLTILRHGGHAVQGKTIAGCRRLERGKVAATLGTEAKIVTDQEQTGLQAFDQNPFDEGLGLERGKAIVEMDHAGSLDAGVRQGLQLVAKRGDALGGLKAGASCCKKLARMRLEGQYAARQRQRRSQFGEPLDQAQMAAVHAIEVADGQCARSALGRWRKASEDLHEEGALKHAAKRLILKHSRRPGRLAMLDSRPPMQQQATKLAILISGHGSNMASLAAACRDEHWPAQVVVVVSSRSDAPGIARARELGLPVEVLPSSAFASREAFDAALIERLDALEVDLVVLAGFMRILTDGFVQHFAGRLVNIHPSLLPAFTGLDTHARALAAGVLVHGASVHLVTPELDHGPLIAQAVVPVLEGDDAATLAARVLRLEHILLPRAVRWMVEGRVQMHHGRVRVEGIDDAQRLIFDNARPADVRHRAAGASAGQA